MDGSHYAWPEDRGPKSTLLLAVDAAASVVFCYSEDTAWVNALPILDSNH